MERDGVIFRLRRNRGMPFEYKNTGVKGIKLPYSYKKTDIMDKMNRLMRGLRRQQENKKRGLIYLE